MANETGESEGMWKIKRNHWLVWYAAYRMHSELLKTRKAMFRIDSILLSRRFFSLPFSIAILLRTDNECLMRTMQCIQF